MNKLVNNENKKMIVEFTHPGKEYIPYKRKDDPNVLFNNKSRDIGKRKWNNLNNHKRKFMKSYGNYLCPSNNLFKYAHNFFLSTLNWLILNKCPFR